MLSLRVKIYVVNYRKVVNIGIPRGRQPVRGAGMFNGMKYFHRKAGDACVARAGFAGGCRPR